MNNAQRGNGGSYVIDPDTQSLELVECTQEVAEQPAAAEPELPAVDPAPTEE